MLLKLLLLQRKVSVPGPAAEQCLTHATQIMFFGYPVERLCTYQYSLVSMVPNLLLSLADAGSPLLDSSNGRRNKAESLKTSDKKSMLRFMGLPLNLFGKVRATACGCWPLTLTRSACAGRILPAVPATAADRPGQQRQELPGRHDEQHLQAAKGVWHGRHRRCEHLLQPDRAATDRMLRSSNTHRSSSSAQIRGCRRRSTSRLPTASGWTSW
jgi:hypothetical protein